MQVKCFVVKVVCVSVVFSESVLLLGVSVEFCECVCEQSRIFGGGCRMEVAVGIHTRVGRQKATPRAKTIAARFRVVRCASPPILPFYSPLSSYATKFEISVMHAPSLRPENISLRSASLRCASSERFAFDNSTPDNNNRSPLPQSL